MSVVASTLGYNVRLKLFPIRRLSFRLLKTPKAITTSFCFDFEIKEFQNIGESLTKTLRRQSEYVKNYILSLFGPKKNLQEVPKKPVVKRAPNNVLQPYKNIKIDGSDPLGHFLYHLQKKGRKTLRRIGKEILSDLKITANITPIVKIVTKEYRNMIQNYYYVLKENRTEAEVDNNVFLDMVETATQILYDKEIELLNNIAINHKISLQNYRVQKMRDKIFKVIVNEKIVTMRYVCHEYQVCRVYSAFTDYCADLFTEALKLTNTKFLKIVNILTMILRHHDKFFDTISEKEDKKLIVENLKERSLNLFEMRRFFVMLRAILTQRFRPVSSNNTELRAQNKAARILMDIIDKTFEADNDLLAIDFDNSVMAIRSWSNNLRDQINYILKDLANNLVRRLKYNLTKNARKEIKVLIKTIMRGNTDNDKVYKRLMKFGSKYVKGEDFHLGLESLTI